MDNVGECSGGHEEFVRLFSRHQRQIYGYIATVLSNSADVEEVLQETSIILWTKFDTFRRDESFVKWACGVAHLQILRFFRQQRRRMLPLEESTIEILLAERTAMEDRLADRRRALAECVKKLRPKDQQLLESCYAPGAKLKDAAQELGRSVGALFHSVGNGPSDAQGKFTLRTFVAGDGALAGEHRVTITKNVPQPAAADNPYPATRNELPARYARPDTSHLVASVEPRGENVFRFELAD